MAFGIERGELRNWKRKVNNKEIAFLTHYWIDDRFPACHTVTKVGCIDINKLINWGRKYEIKEEWIHMHKKFPHFDLFGEKQKEVLTKEQMWDQMARFNI